MALTENDGHSVIVTSSASFSRGRHSVTEGAGEAVEMLPVGNGIWRIYRGRDAAGPSGRAGGHDLGRPPIPTASAPSAAAGARALPGRAAASPCTVRWPPSTRAAYRRTVNVVPLEQYVADVVPNESPAGWGSLGGAGPQGQPWGFQELEAQAVAARSYVMAGLGSYGGYADTCDLACQTYRGTLNESAITDLAVSDTDRAGDGVPQRRGGRHPVLGIDRRLHGPGRRSRRCPTPAIRCASPAPATPITPGRHRFRCRPSRPPGRSSARSQSISITGRNGPRRLGRTGHRP